MATFFKDKEITSIYYGSKALSAVYHGTKLVWEAIRSCFGKGYWINEYPWNNEDAWINNN